MDVEKKAQEIQVQAEGESKTEAVKEAPKEEAGKGPIEEAKEVVERLEKANVETKKLLDRQEKMMVESMIHGKSFAGQNTGKKEISDKEYVQGLRRGGILK